MLGHPYHILAKLPCTDAFNVAKELPADLVITWLHKKFVLVVWSADHSTTGKFWVYNGNNKDQIQLEYIEDIQTSSLEAFSIRQTDKYKDQERNNCFSLHRRHFGQ